MSVLCAACLSTQRGPATSVISSSAPRGPLKCMNAGAGRCGEQQFQVSVAILRSATLPISAVRMLHSGYSILRWCTWSIVIVHSVCNVGPTKFGYNSDEFFWIRVSALGFGCNLSKVENVCWVGCRVSLIDMTVLQGETHRESIAKFIVSSLGTIETRRKTLITQCSSTTTPCRTPASITPRLVRS